MLNLQKHLGMPHIYNADSSEAEQIRQQQQLALLTSRRIMAAPVGRAALTYDSRMPLITDKYPISSMHFDVKIKPSQTTISEDTAVLTPEEKVFGHFHNGVAAGLSISRSCREISASWIIYNKPEEPTNRHAGFLLGLGLNGHLKAMATWHAFNYLTSKHIMTSIGLLLGLSASFVGTMDVMITKLLSVHVLALLPPGSNDLNLSALTQTAGLVGIGLLHFASNHRRISEVLLREISRSDDSIEQFRNESYRLAAGIALGMINVGDGETARTKELNCINTLVKCIEGTDRDDLDLDNKMPGAIVALGLICLKSENKDVARRLQIPRTQHHIEAIRPDLLLLRTMMCSLIMWHTIQPEVAFLTAQLPPGSDWLLTMESTVLTTDGMNIINIVTGACIAIGIKYAGSGNLYARDCVLLQLDKLIRLASASTTGFDQKVCKVTIRNCISCLCFASAMIMAGSGDLEVMRRLRRMHHRIESDVWYGHHMATETSLGLLFISGGRYSLSTSPIAICSFVAAFYPIFPTSTNDNDSHLQALRHLWILGVEPRSIITKETTSHKTCLVPIEIHCRDGSTLHRTAPTLLPMLDTIERVSISSAKYWPVVLDFETGSQHLAAYRQEQVIYVTQRDRSEKQGLDLLDSSSVNVTSSIESAIAAEINDVLQHSSGKAKLVQDCLNSHDPWEAQILDTRATLLAGASSGASGISAAEISMLLAYWDASTGTGYLASKLSQCERRILDDSFVDELRLKQWEHSNR